LIEEHNKKSDFYIKKYWLTKKRKKFYYR
jgi:hypothetical protein